MFPTWGKTPSYYQTPLEQTATNLATEYKSPWSQIINKLQHQYPHKIKTYNLFKAFNKYRQQFFAQCFNITDACIKKISLVSCTRDMLKQHILIIVIPKILITISSLMMFIIYII
ncbi:hypothetical protein [Spiroplasma mirum]|nr:MULTISPECIES: hypothetical protein [Spiroplasma]